MGNNTTMRNHYSILFAMLFSILSVTTYGQVQNTTGKGYGSIRFDINSPVIRKDRYGNEETIKRISQVIESLMFNGDVHHIDSITVVGNASFDGPYLFNKRLSEQRAEAVRSLLTDTFPQLKQVPFLIHSVPENWEMFESMILCDESFEYREEILRLMEEVPDTRRRKTLLKHLDNGRCWKLLAERVLPDNRNTLFCIIWTMPKVDPTAALRMPEKTTAQLSLSKVDTPKMKPVRFGVYTNMLYWLALTPNIGIEWYPSAKWSVHIDGMYTWWELGAFSQEKQPRYKLWEVRPEVRYWFNHKDNLHRGHSLAVYASAGRANLKFGYTGKEGDAYGAGLSYNYVWRLIPALYLELGISAGYVHYKYDKYYYNTDNAKDIYDGSFKTNYFGPTRLNVGLVYRFGGQLFK